MKLFILLFLMLLSPISAHAQDTLPSGLTKLLTAAYPGATPLAAKACELGAQKYHSYGILIKSDTLYAIVAYEQGKSWQIQKIPTAVSYRFGSTPDFLSDFRHSLTEPYDIKCISPKIDSEVSPKINGRFVASFAAQFPAHVKHLCFSASDTYNDWVCESINPATHKVDRTFVQMNAD